MHQEHPAHPRHKRILVGPEGPENLYCAELDVDIGQLGQASAHARFGLFHGAGAGWVWLAVEGLAVWGVAGLAAPSSFLAPWL